MHGKDSSALVAPGPRYTTLVEWSWAYFTTLTAAIGSQGLFNGVFARHLLVAIFLWIPQKTQAPRIQVRMCDSRKCSVSLKSCSFSSRQPLTKIAVISDRNHTIELMTAWDRDLDGLNNHSNTQNSPLWNIGIRNLVEFNCLRNITRQHTHQISQH